MFFLASPSFQVRKSSLAYGSISYAVERRDGCDDQLDPGFLLEVGELALEIGDRHWREDMRFVDDTAGEGGKVRRGPCRADPHRGDKGSDQRARPQAKHPGAPV